MLAYIKYIQPKHIFMIATLIEKESLNDVKFSHEEVLTSQQEITERSAWLTKALILGNAHRGKVKLSFKTAANETLSVYTTVWTVAENYVTLKANRFIPIRSITAIEF